MREIKFRAWDTEKKEMTYTPEVWGESDDYGEDGSYPNRMSINGIFNGGSVTYGEYVFMQYIGHRDIDNKEIFESDILEDDYHVICPVFWDDLETGFRMKSERDWWKCKVIGNIYENPGLLKGNK